MQQIIHIGKTGCDKVLSWMPVTYYCIAKPQNAKDVIYRGELDERNIILPLFCKAKQGNAKRY